MKLYSVIDFFLKPLGKTRRSGLIFGSLILVLFNISAVNMALFFGSPIAVILIGLFLLNIAFYKTRLYALLLKLPLIYQIICLLLGAHLAVRFYGFADGSMFRMLFDSGSCGIVIYSISSLFVSALMSFLSDVPHPKNVFKALAAVFPLLFTVFAYVPSEMYFSNRKDLLYVFFDFAPYIAIKTIVFSLLAAVAACTLKEKAFRVFSCISVGLTLCVYCQYMFMNPDDLSIVGEQFNTEFHTYQIILNTVIWAILLFVPLIYTIIVEKIKAISQNTVVRNGHLVLGSFIGGIQFISLVILIFTTNGSLSLHERYMLDGAEQFTVSSKKNVITFIFDASDRHYFDDAYNSHPEKFDFLHDFTYYTNSCMMYDATYLSIPQMLSGTTTLPESNLNKWVEQTWSSEPCESFYSRLHDENYQVNVFGDFSYNYNYYTGKFDNCRFQDESSIVVHDENVIDNINTLASYRYLPLILKDSINKDLLSSDQAIYYECECIMENNDYLQSLKLEKSDSDKNYFIVEHLLGTHQFSGDPNESVYTCLEILEEYIDQLKSLGLYDDAVIIVTGDHGTHYNPDNVPVWYIKPANTHYDQMQYSNAPIHHSDYLATCIEASGLEKEGDDELFGRSIFEIDEDEPRKRLVFQRYGFDYAGDIDWKKCTGKLHVGGALGYYFIGDRHDLEIREKEGPPDIVLELDDAY